MINTALKKKVYKCIDISEDKILKAVYTLLEANINVYDLNFEFTAEQIKELNKRRKDHLSGKSKSYTFEEIKKEIIAKSKK